MTIRMTAPAARGDGKPVKVALEHQPARDELRGFIGSFPQASFFQTPAWLESLESAYRAMSAAWITAREGGALIGVMPLIRVARGPFSTLWALPFGTYGDPLALDPAVRAALLAEFFRRSRSPFCLESGAVLFRGDVPASIPHGATVLTEESSLVSLEGGLEEIWGARWSPKRRQLVRRGEEAGITVRLLVSETEVARFHEVYREESRPWGGVHPYPQSLFMELFKHRAEGVLFWGAFLGDDFLGCHIDFYFGEMAQAWQGGMTERAKEYETAALLIKWAIAEACERGMRVFNLGSSGGNRGILFFKESLGGRTYRYPVVSLRKPLWRALRGGIGG